MSPDLPDDHEQLEKLESWQLVFNLSSTSWSIHDLDVVDIIVKFSLEDDVVDESAFIVEEVSHVVVSDKDLLHLNHLPLHALAYLHLAY